MSRTNVEVDERLIRRVMRLYGLSSKSAAIDFALRAVAGNKRPSDMLDLAGAGWDGDLKVMRRSRVRRV
jgi:Arc/MetJ family transcription regulator